MNVPPCNLFVYKHSSEPSWALLAAGASLLSANPAFPAICLHAIQFSRKPNNLSFFMLLPSSVHVTPTCGQVHFFSIRFPWYAPSPAWEGQDWIDESIGFRTFFIRHSLMRSKSKQSTVMKLTIEKSFWNHDVKLLILVVTVLDFTLNNQNLRLAKMSENIHIARKDLGLESIYSFWRNYHGEVGAPCSWEHAWETWRPNNFTGLHVRVYTYLQCV